MLSIQPHMLLLQSNASPARDLYRVQSEVHATNFFNSYYLHHPSNPLDTPAHSPIRRTLGQIRRRVQRTAEIHNLILNRSRVIPVRTLRRTNADVPINTLFASGNIDLLQHPLKHSERSFGLVEGHLVARVVDSDETVPPRLFGYAVDGAIRGCDVFVAGVWEAVGVDQGGDGFAANLDGKWSAEGWRWGRRMKGSIPSCNYSRRRQRSGRRTHPAQRGFCFSR